MKQLDVPVTSDQGKVVGRALDRIGDFHERTLAMAECLAAIERWQDAEKKPVRVAHGNVIELFPRSGDRQ